MDITVKKIGETEKEYIEIGCHKKDERIDEIVRFIRSREGILKGTKEDRQYSIALPDILYIEAVDRKTFVYTNSENYESELKLYEIEQELIERDFLRISKNSIVNLRKIKSLKTDINRKIRITLQNGEQIVVSRMYSDELRRKLGLR